MRLIWLISIGFSTVPRECLAFAVGEDPPRLSSSLHHNLSAFLSTVGMQIVFVFCHFCGCSLLAAFCVSLSRSLCSVVVLMRFARLAWLGVASMGTIGRGSLTGRAAHAE